MIVTESHHIKPNHSFYAECDILSLISKNLYNAALYKIRQHYFKHKNFIDGTYTSKSGKEMNNWVFSNTNIYHAMKNEPEFRTDKHQDYNGKLVNTKVLKQTEIQLSNCFSSYFKAVKEYRSKPSKFKGEPRLPNYKNKTGRNVVTFPKDAISWRKHPGFVHLGGTRIFIKPHKATSENIKEIKIVPSVYGYDIIISYQIADITKITNHSKYAAIDLGLNNLATLSSNDSTFKPIIINGRPLKSINQYFNKKKSKLTSFLPSGIYSSKNIRKLYRKRNDKIKEYLHKSSDHIFKEMIKSGITCLIVGSNKHWKSNINIGSRNNQNFVSIPFHKFKLMLKYKCEMAGIEYIETEESYTSKCSFLDLEDICKHDSYIGKRTKRGLFKSNNGLLINADMNGSYNILRKVAGNDVFIYNDMSDLVEDYAVSPTRVTF